jgi:hypothetical protein
MFGKYKVKWVKVKKSKAKRCSKAKCLRSLCSDGKPRRRFGKNCCSCRRPKRKTKPFKMPKAMRVLHNKRQESRRQMNRVLKYQDAGYIKNAKALKALKK